MSIPTPELHGKCVFNDAIRGRIADLQVKDEQITVWAYNPFECALPDNKAEQTFTVEGFWQWIQEKNYKVIDPIRYSIVRLSPVAAAAAAEKAASRPTPASAPLTD